MATKEKTEKTVEKTENALQKQVNALCAVVRKLKSEAEKHWGVDVDGDGKLGSVRVAMLCVILFAGILTAANQLVWSVVPNVAYVDEEGDATFLTVTASGGFVGDVTGDITAATVSGASASVEVLSMAYTAVTTHTTATDGGTYYVNSSGAAVTLTLPDAADILGKTIRVVLVTAGNNLTVNTEAGDVYVAGDGGAADNSAVLDAALDSMWIQSIGTGSYLVLDQVSVSSWTTQ